MVSLAILLESAERGEAMEGVEVALHQGTVGALAMDEGLMLVLAGVTVLVGAPLYVAVTRPASSLNIAVTHPAVPLYVAVTHLEITATAGLHIVGEMSCHMPRGMMQISKFCPSSADDRGNTQLSSKEKNWMHKN